MCIENHIKHYFGRHFINSNTVGSRAGRSYRAQTLIHWRESAKIKLHVCFPRCKMNSTQGKAMLSLCSVVSCCLLPLPSNRWILNRHSPLQRSFGGKSFRVRISSNLLAHSSTLINFGGARSKGFATLRNLSNLTFFDKIGLAKSVGFRFYSAIWRGESRISSRYLEITSISVIYSLTFSRKKELLIWLSCGFEPTHLCDPSHQRRL